MDTNINKIMAAITGDTLLNKILLRDKRYHGTWKRTCFAVKDGTLYYYSEVHQERTRKLRLHVVPATFITAVKRPATPHP